MFIFWKYFLCANVLVTETQFELVELPGISSTLNTCNSVLCKQTIRWPLGSLDLNCTNGLVGSPWNRGFNPCVRPQNVIPYLF